MSLILAGSCVLWEASIGMLTDVSVDTSLDTSVVTWLTLN